jgi:serine protease Do
MNHYFRAALVLATVSCMATPGIGLGQTQSPQTQTRQTPQPDQPLPKIRQDSSPLPTDVKVRSSFAPVAREVGPSVVNVYSRRTVQGRENPLFNDPFFRRFFGGRGDDELGSGGPGSAPRPRTMQGLGSGVIVSEDGYIVTNNHVVENASDIRVAMVGGEEYPARIVGTDPATDLAVLKVDRTGLPAITLSDSTLLEVGDTVLAIGNPFGIGQTVTVGIVSGLGRSGMGIVDYEDFIQTDASINPGNSGGALTDVIGRLIGVNTAILSRTGGNQGVGFAVPVNIVRNVMDQIVQNGRVTRGYMGIYIQPLTPDLARAFDMPDQRGALVASVSPRSPAAEAGLREGDVITRFNGKEVVDSRQFRLMVSQTPPETRTDLEFLRDGKPQSATVRLAELPAQQLADARGRGPGAAEGRGGFLEGLQVAELDSQLRRQFNLANDAEGLVVTDVEPGSAAERAGLERGDIIEEVNRQPVRTMRDATSAIRNRGEGGSVLLRVRDDNRSRYVVVDTARTGNPAEPRRPDDQGTREGERRR